MGQAEVQSAVRKIVAILEGEGMPYAIIGALALNEYGHRRVTVDVDPLMRESDLQAFKSRWLGKGDDKPKPIAFPDPAEAAIRGVPFALLPIERWIELKLASGMVAPHRAKDLVDVQELIRSAKFAREMAVGLDPWVRGKFVELWELAQIDDPF